MRGWRKDRTTPYRVLHTTGNLLGKHVAVWDVGVVGLRDGKGLNADRGSLGVESRVQGEVGGGLLQSTGH